MVKFLLFLKLFVVIVAVVADEKDDPDFIESRFDHELYSDLVSYGSRGDLENSLANAGGKIYLDWSCYPGYLSDTEVEIGDNGHRAAIWAVHECSMPPQISGESYCPKTCILEHHGILNRIFRVVSNPTKEGYLKKIGKFFNKAEAKFAWLPGGFESAKNITKSILSNCKAFMDQYEKGTIKLDNAGCPSPLEDCVQKHTTCPN